MFNLPTEKVNWGHPITSRLCFATLMNDWSAARCRSLVGPSNGVFTGTTIPAWKGGVNAGLFFTGGLATVSYLSYGTDTATIDLGRNTSNPVTFAFSIYAGVGNANAAIAGRNDGNTVSAGWQISFTAGTAITYTKESNTTNMNVTFVVPTSRWITVVIVADGSLTAANQLFYVNGILQVHTLDTNGVGTPGSDSAETLYIGRGNAAYVGANGSLDGTLGFFYIWKRVLTEYEVNLLTVNPMIILQSYKVTGRRISAGGGGAGKGGGGGKKGGGGAKTVLIPGGATYINLGNAGLDVS